MERAGHTCPERSPSLSAPTRSCSTEGERENRHDVAGLCFHLCLSVGWFVSVQKLPHGLQHNLVGGWGSGQGRTHLILVWIQIRAHIQEFLSFFSPSRCEMCLFQHFISWQIKPESFLFKMIRGTRTHQIYSKNQSISLEVLASQTDSKRQKPSLCVLGVMFSAQWLEGKFRL